MRRAAIIWAIPMMLAAVAGCGTDDPTGSGQPPASAESPTRVPRHTDASGRPAVTFDPCLDVPDQVLIDAGYDPASKDESDYPGDYTFLGCTFDTPVRKYGLSLLSGNVTFAEERAKTAAFATPIEINGRPALLKFEDDLTDECSLSMETSYGILIVLRNLNHDDIGPAPQEQWCAGLEDTARLIEPLLPKS